MPYSALVQYIIIHRNKSVWYVVMVEEGAKNNEEEDKMPLGYAKLNV